ncbi:hypothetical protein T265_10132 [Opisthorchis viverrini]|uniref:Reverse transcriptase domain-containing protein n=1 Tax=Opisthorchis viverrini TaxID=6198 RepID=A0A074ZEC1_OPIVI|nr:hypothetical protein T265_10132 [Opisthorchis viverrini]KER21560.1 hypothetical protein T265_10132 [Opisthorchis viverrini]
MVVFIDLKAAFNSMDRQALWQCMRSNGVPYRFLTLLKALYANFRGRVKVYGKLSPEFATFSGVRQGFPLSPFLFNFIIDTIMEDSLSVSNCCGVKVLPKRPLTDIEYADDIALLASDPVVTQTILNIPSNSASRFGVCVTPAKCKVLLHGCVARTIALCLGAGELPIIDRDWAVESLTTIMVGIDVNCICMYGEHLFTTFKNGTVYILTWDGKPLGDFATLSKTPFFHDVEHSRGNEITRRLEREVVGRKVRGLSLTSASRLPLSRLGQPGSIPALMPLRVARQLGTKRLSSPGIFCQAVEWAPTFGGVITILSSGDIALLRVLKNGDGVWKESGLNVPKIQFVSLSTIDSVPWQLGVRKGIWAECTENPVCLSVNNRFRTVAVGSENNPICSDNSDYFVFSTEVSLYRLDETTGTVFVQQRLRVSNREYPDATTLVGPATKLAWSTDGYTLAVAWANCGWALWSVFGGLLHTSLGERVGLADRIKVSQMAWSANDCQLVTVMSFLSPKKNHSPTLERSAAVEVENERCDSEQHQCPAHIAVFQLARSALTTNPTSDNHHHLLLQTSDRVLFSNRSQLTSSRNLQTLLVPALYMKHNWPLRYVAMNMDGGRIAVSGEYGFAHYSCVTRRWNMFGNEVQHRDHMQQLQHPHCPVTVQTFP